MASIHPPSPGLSTRRPRLAVVPRGDAPASHAGGDPAALAAAGSGLDKDWIEACRARVQQRLSACSPAPADEGPNPGLPELLVQALAAFRSLRRRGSPALPTLQSRRLRLRDRSRRD